MIRRILGAATLFLGLLATSLVPSTPAHAAATRPFSVTITHVECIDDCDEAGLEAALEGHADFYAKVCINGVKQPPGSDEDDPSTPIHDNSGLIRPVLGGRHRDPGQRGERAGHDPDLGLRRHPRGDDLGDASPHDNDNNLDFRVSYSNGRWIDRHRGRGQRQLAPVLLDGRRRRQRRAPRQGLLRRRAPRRPPATPTATRCSTAGSSTAINVDGDSDIDIDLPAMGAAPAARTCSWRSTASSPPTTPTARCRGPSRTPSRPSPTHPCRMWTDRQASNSMSTSATCTAKRSTPRRTSPYGPRRRRHEGQLRQLRRGRRPDQRDLEHGRRLGRSHRQGGHRLLHAEGLRREPRSLLPLRPLRPPDQLPGRHRRLHVRLGQGHPRA